MALDLGIIFLLQGSKGEEDRKVVCAYTLCHLYFKVHTVRKGKMSAIINFEGLKIVIKIVHFFGPFNHLILAATFIVFSPPP